MNTNVKEKIKSRKEGVIQDQEARNVTANEVGMTVIVQGIGTVVRDDAAVIDVGAEAETGAIEETIATPGDGEADQEKGRTESHVILTEVVVIVLPPHLDFVLVLKNVLDHH
jgi:hypothetical protein